MHAIDHTAQAKDHLGRGSGKIIYYGQTVANICRPKHFFVNALRGSARHLKQLLSKSDFLKEKAKENWQTTVRGGDNNRKKLLKTKW